MTDTTIDFRVEISSHEHSRLVQEVLFDMGYFWGEGEHRIFEHTVQPYLYAESDMRIRYTTGKLSVRSKAAPVYEINSTLTPVPVPTVTIVAGEYSADSLRQLIKDLES